MGGLAGRRDNLAQSLTGSVFVLQLVLPFFLCSWLWDPGGQGKFGLVTDSIF